MSEWTFVCMAYAVALGGAAGLTIWSWIGMRRDEAQAEAAKPRR